MIAVMMVMDNNSNKMSRLFSLLFLMPAFFLISCNFKEKKVKIKEEVSNTKEQEIINDSVELVIRNLPPKTETGFYFLDDNLIAQRIVLKNESSDTLSISKSFKKPSYDYELIYKSSVVIKNVLAVYNHNYYCQNDLNKIEFEFNVENWDILLKTEDKRIKVLDGILESYSKNYRDNNLKNKSIKKKGFEELFKANKEYYKKTDDKVRLQYNEVEFLNRLSVIYPNDKRIVDYLSNLEKPILNSRLSGMFYNYVKSIQDSIYLIDLEKPEGTKRFKEILPVFVSSNLEEFKENKYTNYNNNLEWLRKTNYYKINSKRIENQLKMNNFSKSIVDYLKKFNVNDKNNNKSDFEVIVNRHKGNYNYFLFDFWASWCAPCIKDSKLIHKMELPKSLKIINVSLDKTKDKNKWLLKAKELAIEDSYLFIENESNKKFIQNINLNQIPRYILIDKDFKIINIDMISPSEGDFKKELEKYIKE